MSDLWITFRSTVSWCGIGLLLAVSIGCAAAKPAAVTIHDSPRGSVTLEPMPETGRSAAHPIKLEPAVIENVLRGIRLKDRGSVTGTFFNSDATIIPAFGESDIQFLAPYLADALQRARADQVVQFTLRHPDPLRVSSIKTGAGVGSSDSMLNSRTALTSGMLYAYGMSLYVTISEVAHRPSPADTIRGPNRQYSDEGGLTNRDIIFRPESAVRPDSYKQTSGWLGSSSATTFALDYEMLGKMAPVAERTPPPPSRPNAVTAEPPQRALQDAERVGAPKPALPPGATAGESSDQDLKDLVIKKDLEVEALKKELRELKKQLGNRDAQTETPKKKPSNSKKPPASTP
jgi:hypothetical protein